MEDMDITWGGYSKKNIKRWLLIECMESGDAENFWLAMSECMEELAWEHNNTSEIGFWKNVETMLKGGE